MTLKVQGAWEAEKLIDLLRTVSHIETDNKWLVDLLARLTLQYEAEKKRRILKDAFKKKRQGDFANEHTKERSKEED